ARGIEGGSRRATSRRGLAATVRCQPLFFYPSLRGILHIGGKNSVFAFRLGHKPIVEIHELILIEAVDAVVFGERPA
ncbi:MAG TPA: hypothetical protein VG711_02810, partial [Phycisphaerales bacterium]|nr:hypothetical protein [Phycisphaerales bacterium]